MGLVILTGFRGVMVTFEARRAQVRPAVVVVSPPADNEVASVNVGEKGAVLVVTAVLGLFSEAVVFAVEGLAWEVLGLEEDMVPLRRNGSLADFEDFVVLAVPGLLHMAGFGALVEEVPGRLAAGVSGVVSVVVMMGVGVVITGVAFAVVTLGGSLGGTGGGASTRESASFHLNSASLVRHGADFWFSSEAMMVVIQRRFRPVSVPGWACPLFPSVLAFLSGVRQA
jgi:hypothetical protein